MEQKPKRRLLRFSLSTLLLGVTLLCIFLAWQVSVVRQRRALLSQAMNRGGSYSALMAPRTAAELLGMSSRGPAWQLTKDGSPSSRRFHASTIPWFRKLLGDQPIAFIRLSRNSTDDEVAQLDRHFPEATLYYMSLSR
jgi:hypothetical protein